MSLRVPNSVLFLRATSNLNRASLNLFRNESILTSGKRIEKLSDDATGAVQLIGLNRQKLDLNRYLETISDSRALLGSADNALQGISDLISQAKQFVLQAGNQVLPQDGGLNVIADQVDQLLNQALGLGNQQVNGHFIFSGTAGDTTPYSINTRSDGSTYSSYNGNNQSLSVQIGFGVNFEPSLPGSQIFSEQRRAATTYTDYGHSGAVPGSNPDTGIGNDTIRITHGTTSYAGTTGVAAGTSSAASDTVIGPVGAHSLVIDDTAKTISLNGGPAVSYVGTETNLAVSNPVTDSNGNLLYTDTVYVNTTGITASGTANITSTGYLSTDGGTTSTLITYGANQRVIDSVTGQLTNVNSTNIRRVGDVYATYNGTFDLFTTLKNLRDDLRNTRNLSQTDQIASIQARTAQLTNIHNQVLKSLGVVGGRSAQLDNVSDHLEGNKTQVEKLISTVQDADLASAITDFTRSQAALEYTQAVTARVLQISLVNFLK